MKRPRPPKMTKAQRARLAAIESEVDDLDGQLTEAGAVLRKARLAKKIARLRYLEVELKISNLYDERNAIMPFRHVRVVRVARPRKRPTK